MVLGLAAPCRASESRDALPRRRAARARRARLGASAAAGSVGASHGAAAADSPPRGRRARAPLHQPDERLEALPALEAAGVAPEPAFVRVQSSHCEANNHYGVLENLDHNLLMHLALGATKSMFCSPRSRTSLALAHGCAPVSPAR